MVLLLQTMSRYLLLILSFLFLACSALTAQPAPHRSGEFLISLSEDLERPDFIHGFDPACSFEKISNLLNIWLLRSQFPEDETLEWLRKQPEVRMAQFNHILEDRSEPAFKNQSILPDDPLFLQQWHLMNDGSSGGVPNADLDAEQAWEITNGGVSPAGDTIVIAVIDGGIQASHPDLAPNLWKNWAEIPNNGIDDDQNGYTDDFRGWNPFAQNDQIQGNSTTHGTPVSAILGARGNNGLGVTGVNWNTRILFVAASGLESEILAAFDYVRRARQRYNLSSGANGAFVVALNCSWGINYGQPSEAPLWCAAYDEMGAEGILSVASTANIPVNVDEVGDLPTTCPSEFLLGVTSLNSSDEKALTAAWGPQHVDLGAYGQNVFTTSAVGGYGTFSGTSYAAPQVAGAIGLLYSAPCPSLIALAKLNPASAASWVKNLILENVSPNPSLSGITVSDGRLNLFTVIKHYEDQCSGCPAPFALNSEVQGETSARLFWTTTSATNEVNLRWRKQGEGVWNFMEAVPDSLLVEGLSGCMAYEFEVQSVCAQGVLSSWSQPFLFQTQGCCTTPSAIWLEISTEHSAKLGWESSSDLHTYRLRLREDGTMSWLVFEANTNSWAFEDLKACTQYQVQVQALCEDLVTDFSPVFYFTTKGCGACNEVEYCSAKANDATEEWIASVQIGAWFYDSGAGGNGYQNFGANLLSLPELYAGSTVQIQVSPGFSGLVSKEYYRVFVDYNQDGDFEDDQELVFDPGYSLEGVAAGMIEVPADLTPGISRMRVMMQFTNPNDDPPMPCSSFEFGQVEDYCIGLRQDSVLSSIPGQDETILIRIYPQPAVDWIMLEIPEEMRGKECSLKVANACGQTMGQQSKLMLQNTKMYLDVSAWPSGIYVIQIRVGEQELRSRVLKI